MVSAMDARGGEVYRGTREECDRRAWDAFVITRERYAELIAVERVREVAEAKYGDHLFCVEANIGGGWSEVKVWLSFPGNKVNDQDECDGNHQYRYDPDNGR